MEFRDLQKKKKKKIFNWFDFTEKKYYISICNDRVVNQLIDPS